MEQTEEARALQRELLWAATDPSRWDTDPALWPPGTTPRSRSCGSVPIQVLADDTGSTSSDTQSTLSELNLETAGSRELEHRQHRQNWHQQQQQQPLRWQPIWFEPRAAGSSTTLGSSSAGTDSSPPLRLDPEEESRVLELTQRLRERLRESGEQLVQPGSPVEVLTVPAAHRREETDVTSQAGTGGTVVQSAWRSSLVVSSPDDREGEGVGRAGAGGARIHIARRRDVVAYARPPHATRPADDRRGCPVMTTMTAWSRPQGPNTEPYLSLPAD